MPTAAAATAPMATILHFPILSRGISPAHPAAYPNHAARESPATRATAVAATITPANPRSHPLLLPARHTHAATPAQAVNPLHIPLFPMLPVIPFHSRQWRNPSVASASPNPACAAHAASSVHHPHRSPRHPHARAAAYTIPVPAHRHTTSRSTVSHAHAIPAASHASSPATAASIHVTLTRFSPRLRPPANAHAAITAAVATTPSISFTPCRVASPASAPHGTSTAATIAIHAHALHPASHAFVWIIMDLFLFQ